MTAWCLAPCGREAGAYCASGSMNLRIAMKSACCGGFNWHCVKGSMRWSYSQQAPDRRHRKDTRDSLPELLNLSWGGRADHIVSSGTHSWFLMPLIAEIEPAFDLISPRKRDLAFMLQSLGDDAGCEASLAGRSPDRCQAIQTNHLRNASIWAASAAGRSSMMR